MTARDAYSAAAGRCRGRLPKAAPCPTIAAGAGRWPLAAVVFAIGTAGHAPDAAAGTGYVVGQESVGSLGVAHAGGAAAADVSTVFYNPAGMTRIQGNQWMFGGVGIFPFVDYDEQNSVLSNGTRVRGSEGGDGGQDVLVPHFYGVYSLPNGIKLGLGINSPFGLITNYEENWLGRYSEITTSLKTFNVNPAIAGTVLPGLSVGGGINVQHSRGKLVQAIDFGSNCVSILGAAACNNLGLVPGQTDGRGRVKGTAWGVGFNVGALYEINERTRIGAHYRSRVNLNFAGDGKFDLPPGAASFLSQIGLPTAFTKSDADFILVEPEMASVSAYHELTDKWAVMADVTWTRWAVFEKLRIEFENQTPDNLLLTKWDNVFRYSLGTTYKPSPKLVWRAGVAFDDSPINGDFRGPGIPDSDRIVLAIGLGYAVADDAWIDLGYQHLFFKTGNTRRVSATNSVLNGDFHVNVDVFGVSYTMKW